MEPCDPAPGGAARHRVARRTRAHRPSRIPRACYELRGANWSSSAVALLEPGRAAGFTNRQTSAQALASDASTAIIAITKAIMMMALPTMTRQLTGPDMRLRAR